MPELPEVETIKNQLNKYIPKKIVKRIYQSNLNLHGKEVPSLQDLIEQEIIKVDRRNKFVVIETTHNFILLHMGMTGQLIFSDKLPENQKHIHMILYFENDLMYYKDVRRFGSINYFSKNEFPNYNDIPLIKVLGIEPLSEEFTQDYLNSLVKDCSKRAKQFIMDNSKICGIGNIYANEILFLSKINPMEKIKNITEEQKLALYKNIKEVLKKAIEMGGSTISDFLHIDGTKGGMQNYYYVYGKVKENCKICSTKIEKIMQNGRSSFFCPSCQKMTLLENEELNTKQKDKADSL